MHIEELEDLPKDPIQALEHVIKRFEEAHSRWSELEREERIARAKFLIRTTAVAAAIARQHPRFAQLEVPQIDLSESAEQKAVLAAMGRYMRDLRNSISSWQNEQKFEDLISEFERNINFGFRYEFSDEQLSRIQSLINELRDAISRSTKLTEEHKRRLLVRLEKLQGQLHKYVRDLDVALGTVLEITAAIRQASGDLLPAKKLVKELWQIIQDVCERAGALPPRDDLDLLSPPGKNEED